MLTTGPCSRRTGARHGHTVRYGRARLRHTAQPADSRATLRLGTAAGVLRLRRCKSSLNGLFGCALLRAHDLQRALPEAFALVIIASKCKTVWVSVSGVDHTQRRRPGETSRRCRGNSRYAGRPGWLFRTAPPQRTLWPPRGTRLPPMNARSANSYSPASSPMVSSRNTPGGDRTRSAPSGERAGYGIPDDAMISATRVEALGMTRRQHQHGARIA